MIHGLAERLKELRIKSNYSQREVAQKLYVSPSIISGYETGERTPSVESLLALSCIYRCSTDYLLGKETVTQSDILDVSGLTEQQVRVLIDLIKVFKQLKSTNYIFV